MNVLVKDHIVVRALDRALRGRVVGTSRRIQRALRRHLARLSY